MLIRAAFKNKKKTDFLGVMLNFTCKHEEGVTKKYMDNIWKGKENA